MPPLSDADREPEPRARPAVHVVVIHSLSFTGTTWLNALLGSHERAFALGPPDRVWSLRGEGWDEACRVHGADCGFWPAFHRCYDPDRNLFVQLAERSGRDYVVTNNPLADGAGRELAHPDVVQHHVRLVRDGRAIAASHARHQPGTSYLDAVTDFLYPAFSQFYFDPDDPDVLCLRYEDVVADPGVALARAGEFLGLDYPDSALRFYEHDHHLTAGNAGLVYQIRRAQGSQAGRFKSRDFYGERFESMRAAGGSAIEDTRWQAELSRRDRFVFDVVCGDINARLGYERDRFALDEVVGYAREFGEALADDAVSPRVAPLVRDRVNAFFSAEPAAGADARPRPAGLRAQLDPRWLLRHGLSLSPADLMHLKVRLLQHGFALSPAGVRKLLALGLGALAAVVLLSALVTWLVVT